MRNPSPTEVRRLRLKSCIRLVIATLMTLSWIGVAAAQGSNPAAEKVSKSIKGTITDENKKPIENAKITMVVFCSCLPPLSDCMKKENDCTLCCAPGKVRQSVIATTSTGEAGKFELSGIGPGNYTLKIEGGKYTQDVDIRVTNDLKIELVKAPGVKVIDHNTATAFQVPLTVSKG